MKRPGAVLLSILILFLAGCKPEKQFIRLSPDESGIRFGNALTIADTMNILDNELVYNGGGVTVADWNGDGLTDIFFTANMVDNALYLNRGDMRFEEVTRASGVSKPFACWSAGATVVDVNADGRLDLYVSNMMYGRAELRRNLLYVNQGNDAQGVPRFREQGREYRLDDDSHSAQTVFFDYDRDGDLDAYVLVNVMDMQFANQYLSKAARENSPTADRLLRNDWDSTAGHPVFTDVSREAGIQAQGYGHGVSITDVNKDGWPDIYVTNDYLSNDNLFINSGADTSGLRFRDRIRDCVKHQSWSAMGNDVADINNDGWPDLFAVDMLPDYNERKKALLRANNYTHYQFTEQFDYAYQHIRNTLQLHRGLDPQTGLPRFSEISLLAGVAETDWSWCPLWLDADNDGYRDLFITNGFPKDITDQDFLAYRKDIRSIATSKADLYRMIPEVRIPNYFFRNKGDLTFSDKSADWGVDTPTFSNGAAYADFDGDGDLDLVVNNTNDYAHLYRNTQNDRHSRSRYLRVRLAGPRPNPLGIGAKVEAFGPRFYAYAEQTVVRGYLSSSESILHIGLDSLDRLDSVRIIWPDQRRQTLHRVKANQLLTVRYTESLPRQAAEVQKNTFWEDVDPAALGLAFRHPETDFIDFNIQKTLPHKFSHYGPALAAGDVNGDGRDDFFLGGSSRLEGTFFIQQADGAFRRQQQNLKKLPDKKEEDQGLLLFDADGDGDLDLYCARGSYQQQVGSPLLQDVLYVNDGRGNFRPDSLALPRETENSLAVKAADYDRDGDLDLFVGGGVLPGSYPKASRSFLLRNDSRPGRPRFIDVTRQAAPGLASPGIITDALWTDYDNDGWVDLLLVGEWMRPIFFKNRQGRLSAGEIVLSPGWWTSLCGGDFDNDGDTDYVIGNYGLNTAFRASAKEPLDVWADDFDANGSHDPILVQYDNNQKGERHPYVYHTRDDLIKQSILFRRKFLTYADFGRSIWPDVLTGSQRQQAEKHTVTNLASCYVENRGGGRFDIRPLPVEVQFSPVFGMLPYDVNEDDLPDLLLVGNEYGMELLQGQADASCGTVLINRGEGRFRAMDPAQSGFVVSGDARALAQIRGHEGKPLVIATQNRDSLRVSTRPTRTFRWLDVRPDDAVAQLKLSGGRRRRVELYYGQSFLSQSSRRLLVEAGVREVTITTYRGQTRTEKLP